MDDTAGESSDERRTTVTIRRAPKFSVFLVVGVLVGILAALILSSVFPPDPAVGFAATFGYLALYAVPIGVVLSALIAILLDGRASRRASQVIAGKLEVQQDDAVQDKIVQDEIVQDEIAHDDSAQATREQGDG